MNKISKEDLNDISSSKENMKKKKSIFLNKNSFNSMVSKSNSLDLYETNNNSKYFSNNPSIEQKKNFDNYEGCKNILDIKDTKKGNNKINFLRKKTKINFIITKEIEKKPKFFTTKYFRKSDKISFGKSHNKNAKKICKKKKLFRTYNYSYFDDSIKNTNEGKWSSEEHIKFIESFVNYGKKWATIQKCVGTRSSSQVRSHAQKFFFRLKRLNTDKYSFNLRNNNIKSLSDVINIIEINNKTGKNNKEYLIDTLIALSDLNRGNKAKKFFERKKDNLILEIKQEKTVNDKISKIDDKILNKINSNNNKSKLDDFISGTDLINDLIKDEDEDEDIIPNKQSYIEERYIHNKFLELKERGVYDNNDIVQGQIWSNSFKNVDNSINENFIGNNNSIIISDYSSFCNIDISSVEPMNNIYLRKILNKHF